MAEKQAAYKGYKSDHVNSLCDTIIYSNYDPAKLNSVIFPTMAGITNPDPEYFIRRAMDQNYKYLYVLEYVISGKGYIESGKRKYTVQAGDFYLLNRYTVPYYYPDPADPFSKIWLNVSGRFINALTYTYQITEPVLIVHDESLEPYLRRIHDELLRYPIQETEKSYDAIMAHLLAMFQKIDHIRHKAPTVKKNATFSQITDYISNNILLENMDVDYVSSYFYMSYSTLYRICMKHVGLSPKHYILKLKTDYAKTLLSTTNCTIAKVSEALNFSSPLYFGKVFKKYTGISPLNWKKHEQNSGT